MESGRRVNRRSFAAAILAVPVLAAIYLRAATRPGPVSRIAIAGIVLLAVVTVAGTARPDASQARGHATAPPAATFRPVVAANAAPSPATAVVDAGLAARPATVAPTPDPPPADRAGEIALAASVPAPSVVRFRPRAGASDVAAPIEVSVRFDQAMDRTSTTAAFSIVVDGAAWTGKPRWAERDTVLVLRLRSRLPAGATVRLAVSGTARSAEGKALAAPSEATFTVAVPPPAPKPTPRPTPTQRPAATPRPSTSGWSWPLIGPITQRFGQSLTKYGFHQGLDIDGDTGDPVRAARAGRVTLAGIGDACGGIQVHLDHGGGLETWYRHLSAVSVSVGQQVAGGQVVGKVGATGCALGSHLHFGVRVDGTFVDPLRYLPQR